MKKINYFTILFVSMLLFAVSAYASSPRMILSEEFTNASCPPCAAYNPAYESYLASHLNEVIPVTYHANWPGATDPMYLNDATMNSARISYYSITGVPTVVVEGTEHLSPPSVESGVAKYRGMTSPISITIHESKNGSNVNVTVTVSSDNALSGKVLQIVAIEHSHSYTNAGTNGETYFPYLARKMMPNPTGTQLNISAGGNQVINASYTIKSDWTADSMYVVAFVQDNGTKEVLQAASSMKTVIAPLSVNNPYISIDPMQTLTKDITLQNQTGQDMTVDIFIDNTNSVILGGWNASLSSNQVVVPSNSNATVTLTLTSSNGAGFVSVIITAQPESSTAIPIITNAGVYALSTKTKFLSFLNSWDVSAGTVQNAFNLDPIFNGYVAEVPLTPGFLTAFPLQNYEGALFSFINPYEGSYGLLSGLSTLSSQFLSSINAMVTAGKKIFIASELDATFAFGSNGTSQARDFYSNTLGIQSSDTIARYSIVSGNIVPTTFSAQGVTGDSTSDGFTSNMNTYNSTSFPYFNLYSDNFTLSSTGNAVPIIHYDNNSARIGGIRVQKANAKIVYLGFNPEIIVDNAQQTTLIANIRNWLFGDILNNGAKISIDNSNINFGSVMVGNNLSKTFIISNDGNKDLVVSGLTWSWNDDNVFTFPADEETSFTVPAGQIHTVNLIFTPKTAMDYTGMLGVVSNAINNPTAYIQIDGMGGTGSGAKISTDAVNNTLDFQDVTVGSHKLIDLQVNNDGNTDLIISSVNFVKNDGTFSFDAGANTPITIPSKIHKLITVRFAPNSAIVYGDTIRMLSNASNNPTMDIIVKGSGTTSSVPIDNPLSSFVQVQPNPVSDNTSSVVYNVGEGNQYVELYLIDMSGRKVMDLVNQFKNSGSYNLQLNSSMLVNGKYILTGKIGDKQVSLSVVVSK